MLTRYRLFLPLLALVLGFLTSCSSGGGGPVGPPVVPTGHDQVALSLITGWWQGSAEEGPSADIPAEVSSVSLNITTADSTISRQTTLSAGDLRAEFSATVTTGQLARFQIEATDLSDATLYRGVFYRRVPAQDDSLFVTMAPVTDQTAPTMASSLTVTPRGGQDLELTWEMATTGRGPDYQASYLIWATPSGETPGALPTMATATGETTLLLSLLQPGTSYDLVVRAVDSGGNISSGAASQTTETPNTYAGLYVDVATGQDSPDRGSQDKPFKTITYALSRTEGYEPIYIKSGIYSADTGETFPLVLKPSTQLKGELQFEYGYPLVRIIVGTAQSAIECHDWNSLSGLKLINESEQSFAGSMVDAREGDLVTDFMVIDGNGGYSMAGILAGQVALIRNSQFANLPQGDGVYVFGDDSSKILGCQFANCSSGIAIEGAQTLVANCKINFCPFAIVGNYDPSRISLLNTLVTESDTAIQLDGATNSLIYGCQIMNNSSTGIDLSGCDSTMTIEECWCEGNETGIHIRSGSATLFQNRLTCNEFTNLVVSGSDLVDARHNHWSNNPPVVVSDGGGSNHSGVIDIYYEEDYAGTPAPLWSPSLGAVGCTQFLISPLTGKEIQGPLKNTFR